MNPNGMAAIVTGGTSGLGRATASMLLAQGARVALLDLNAGNETTEPLAGALALAADVTDEDSVAAALAAAEAAHGPARILVNCAGVATVARTVNRDNSPHSLSLFRKAVEVNLVGTFNMIAQFASRLLLSAEGAEDAERGVVINTASVAAFDGQIGQAAYSASKAGVAGMTLPLARDLSQHRIRVVTIAPGIFLTPMLMGLPQAAQDSLGEQVPHPRRLGHPDEFADLAGAIIGNPMLNGDTIRLDGALRPGPR